MPIIVNNVTIPTNGNYIVINGVQIDKVNAIKNGVTTTVWEKKVEQTPETQTELSNYITVESSKDGELNIENLSGSCHSPGVYLGCAIWYQKNGGSGETTFVIKPKEGYSKIKATIHTIRDLVHNDYDSASTYINGSSVSISGFDEEVSGSQITVYMRVSTVGWDDHWKTSIAACIHNITVYN